MLINAYLSAAEMSMHMINNYKYCHEEKQQNVCQTITITVECGMNVLKYCKDLGSVVQRILSLYNDVNSKTSNSLRMGYYVWAIS